jgi:lipid II:glycine glycyltransferase (peptidoglycan interpeptide bridge formation enzyme)
MLSARSLGYRRYDLGGFPLTQTNAEKVAIAKFKAEFGGEIVVEFNGLLSRNRLLQRTLPAVQRIFT